MSDLEKAFLALLAIGLVALVIHRSVTTSGVGGDASITPPAPTVGSMDAGPSYLTFNMPYAFMPPVQNFMPRVDSGQIGQTLTMTSPCDGCA